MVKYNLGVYLVSCKIFSISLDYAKKSFYSVSGKKRPECFCNIFYKNWGDSDEICYTVSWINLLQKCVNVFQLTRIISLYLVKLEMFITQVLPRHCQIKKLQNLSHLNYGLQIRQIWIQLITACGNTAREGVQNTHHWSAAIDDATDEWLLQWRFSRCFSPARSVIHVLYTFSCSIPALCNQLDSNLANLEAIVEMG